MINLGITLRDVGAEVTFLLHESWGTELIGKEVTSLGFRWVALPFGTIWSPSLLLWSPSKLFGNLLALMRVRTRFRAVCAEGKYCAIILGNIPFAFYLTSALRELPLVRIFRHGDEPIDTNFVNRWMTKQVFSMSNYHVANCRFLKQKIGAFDENIVPTVIYNCPVHFFKAWKNAPTISDKKLLSGRTLLFIGQMANHKGADLALRAFDRLAERYSDLSLVFVGSAPGVGQKTNYLQELVRMQSKWGQRIRFTPFLSDTSSAYRDAAIHLCPSIWDDPSPNVILEAKFFGAPTVAFRKGGIPELIEHERDGYLCAEPSENGLVEGIRYFLDRPELLSAASDAARNSVEQRFSYGIFKEQWRALVEAALAEPI